MRRFVIRITTLLLISIVVAISFSNEVSCASPISNLTDSYIEIEDFSKDYVQVYLVLREETSSNDTRQRSTNWFVPSRDSSIAYPFGRADPDWKLIGTNNVTTWRWELRKLLYLNWRPNFEPFLIFPCESFSTSFYLATNGTWYTVFGGIIEVRNFVISHLNVESVDYSEINWTFEGCPNLIKIDIGVSHSFDYKMEILLLYLVIIVTIVASAMLVKKREAVDSRIFVQISLGLLVFSPVLFFSFRGSLAPAWITLFDFFCFIPAFVCGSGLLWKIRSFSRKLAKEKPQ